MPTLEQSKASSSKKVAKMFQTIREMVKLPLTGVDSSAALTFPRGSGQARTLPGHRLMCLVDGPHSEQRAES